MEQLIILKTGFLVDKMSETIDSIIKLVIILFVLVIVILGIVFLVKGNFDIFPEFKKVDKAKWDEEFFLEYPGEVIYYIDGKEAGIYLRYSKDIIEASENEVKEIGWRWSKSGSDDIKEWFDADKSYIAYETSGGYFSRPENKYLNEENRNFLKEINGKSPEKGLEIIVNRVLENNLNLEIFIGNWDENYNGRKHANFLSNLDSVIDKINQISRGVVKNR